MGEQAYLDLLKDIMENGVEKQDRTGVGTRSVWGRQLRFDMGQGFPLLTTKRMFFKGIAVELLWFLKGSTNIKYLVDNGVSIWSSWPWKHYVNSTGLNVDLKAFEDHVRADELFARRWGELGPVYGKQWRKWEYFRFVDDIEDPCDVTEYLDQIEKSIDLLRSDPNSRRNIVTAWNPADIDEMVISGLPPCHYSFQLGTRPISQDDWFIHANIDQRGYVGMKSGRNKYKLDMIVNMRSADCFLGVPFNIASYALLLHMIAQTVDMVPGELVLSTADTHIYNNHRSQVQQQLGRNVRTLPRLILNSDIKNIDDFSLDSFGIQGYDPHPSIKGEVAI